jgi:Cu+-exporting ATPase
VGTGTDVAIEAADMVLVSGDITKITELVDISARTMRIIKQNLFWALGYNTVAIPVAAIGKLTPMIASAAMAMSSVSVVANSLRIQRRSAGVARRSGGVDPSQDRTLRRNYEH